MSLASRRTPCPRATCRHYKNEVAILHRQLAATNLRLTHVDSQVSSLGANLTTVQADVGNIQSSSTAGQVAGLKHTISQMQQCVPEIQTEIGGLGIDWNISGDDSSNDSFTISNPTIITGTCSKVLYGDG
jgi:hypothetical protein